MNQRLQTPNRDVSRGGGRVLVDNRDKGGGVAIFPRLVVTARHVIGDRQPEAPVTFKPQGKGTVPAVGAIRFVNERDAAALGLASDVAWSGLARACEGERWSVGSTGISNDPDLTGIVTRSDLQITDSKGNQLAAMQLLVNQELGWYGGYSGSAVFNSEHEVLGILIEQLPQRLNIPRPPASNVLFALPISDVIERLQIKMPAPDKRLRENARAAAGEGNQVPQGYLLRECFAPIIEYYTRTQTNVWADQDHVMRRLNGFLQNSQAGYLAVVGPPRSGKTALICTLLTAKPSRVAYHFFSDWYDDGLKESFFLQNIVQQVARLLGTSEDIPESLGQLRAMYHHLISETTIDPVIIILDGVDNVTSWQLRPYLSRHLSGNLRFVITMQHEQDIAAKYYIPENQTTVLDLDSAHEQGSDRTRILSTQVSGASLAAGQALNAMIDQLQASVLLSEFNAATEQAQYQELQIESDANNAAARSVAQAAQHKLQTNSKIFQGFDQVISGPE